MWWREKGGVRQYGPEPIRTELAVGVKNLFVLGEDTLAVWAMDNVKPAGVTALGIIPESARPGLSAQIQSRPRHSRRAGDLTRTPAFAVSGELNHRSVY